MSRPQLCISCCDTLITEYNKIAFADYSVSIAHRICNRTAGREEKSVRAVAARESAHIQLKVGELSIFQAKSLRFFGALIESECTWKLKINT